MGSHFNVSWRWIRANVEELLRVLPLLDKPVFHICSGMSNIGDVRVDKTKIELKLGLKGRWMTQFNGTCNCLGDMTKLPFKDGVAGSVICDPPYDYDFTQPELINEILRISKPKAKIIFIAPWVPDSKVMTIKKTELWKVGKTRPYHKILTLAYKSNGQLSDYCMS